MLTHEQALGLLQLLGDLSTSNMQFSSRCNELMQQLAEVQSDPREDRTPAGEEPPPSAK